MEITKIFGDNVRKYRLEANISQEGLADLCGLHRTYISDIERYRRNASLESAEKIAKALKVKPSDLLKEGK